MKINMISGDEMKALIKRNQSRGSLRQYDEWKKVWTQVQTYLETVGIEYNCMTEIGDFIVGADWWEDRCIDLNFLSQKMLAESILQGLHKLVSELKDDWVLNVAGEHSSTPIFFDMLICKAGIYASINEELTEAKNAKVEPWISLLKNLCR